MTFCRDVRPGEPGLAGRDYLAVWEDVLHRSGLPVAETAAGRLRFTLAAPLPLLASSEAELAELWLTSRLPAWRLREAVTPLLPGGHRITSLEDVWMGAPALAGRVAAADYRVTLAPDPDAQSLSAAVRRVLDAKTLPRERQKGSAFRSYDLRPLLLDVQIADAGPPVILRFRGRIHPELGSGRPEEILAAIGDEVGVDLDAVETVRERLVLIDDLEA